MFELSNIVDMASTFLNLFLLVADDLHPESWTNYEESTEKPLVALAVMLVWIKLFYWMRLMESTAFFIDLLEDTIKDANF